MNGFQFVLEFGDAHTSGNNTLAVVCSGSFFFVFVVFVFVVTTLTITITAVILVRGTTVFIIVVFVVIIIIDTIRQGRKGAPDANSDSVGSDGPVAIWRRQPP